MKTILLSVSVFFSALAFATPGEMRLISPSKIEVTGSGLKLAFLLPCKNDSALDWSQIVMTNDDSGDKAAAVGLVYSTADSVCGSSKKMKKFELTIDPGKYGYPVDSTYEYIPMDLAK
jgi:hypothetical protein